MNTFDFEKYFKSTFTYTFAKNNKSFLKTLNDYVNTLYTLSDGDNNPFIKEINNNIANLNNDDFNKSFYNMLNNLVSKHSLNSKESQSTIQNKLELNQIEQSSLSYLHITYILRSIYNHDYFFPFVVNFSLSKYIHEELANQLLQNELIFAFFTDNYKIFLNYVNQSTRENNVTSAFGFIPFLLSLNAIKNSIIREGTLSISEEILKERIFNTFKITLINTLENPKSNFFAKLSLIRASYANSFVFDKLGVPEEITKLIKQINPEFKENQNNSNLLSTQISCFNDESFVFNYKYEYGTKNSRLISKNFRIDKMAITVTKDNYFITEYAKKIMDKFKEKNLLKEYLDNIFVHELMIYSLDTLFCCQEFYSRDKNIDQLIEYYIKLNYPKVDFDFNSINDAFAILIRDFATTIKEDYFDALDTNCLLF